MSDTNILDEGIKIKITKKDAEFTIKEFVLKERIEVLKAISSGFDNLGKSGVTLNMTDNKVMAIYAITVFGEKLADIYVTVLGKDMEWCLANIRMKDEIKIVKAILEVNDFNFLLKELKGALPKAPDSQ